MKHRFLFTSLIALACAALPVAAQTLSKDKIPAVVLDSFYKQHPNAINISGETKKHFGQNLVALYFTEGEKKIEDDKEIDNSFVEFYKADGHFYVNATKVNTSESTNMMSAAANDNLKAAFSNGYSIKELILIANPNGIGEEFDVVISAGDENWRISIDKKGVISAKERE